MVAALMHLLGTASGTAFNLAIAMTFALTASTSCGLLINLLVQKAQDLHQTLDRKKLRRILLISLLAPLFILIVSNGEGISGDAAFPRSFLAGAGGWQSYLRILGLAGYPGPDPGTQPTAGLEPQPHGRNLVVARVARAAGLHDHRTAP